MNKADVKQNFFGRRNLLDLFSRRVMDLKEGYRQNVALLGPRFCGKSVLLQKFLAELDDEAVISIYLDLDTKDVHYFFSKFMGSLLYNFSRYRGLPLHEDLNLLMKSVQRWVPLTVEHMKRIQAGVAKRKFADSIRDLLTLPEIFTVETGKFCVIVLDEFQCLEDMDMPDVFVELGKKIMTQKKCLYFMASSQPDRAKRILAEKLSLLFGNFELIPLSSLDVRTGQEFIDAALAGLRIDASLRNFLVDFTGGQPLYLHLICQELMAVAAVNLQLEVSLPLFSSAIENTVCNTWGPLSRHFELTMEHLCVGKGNHLNAMILIAVANGHHRVKELTVKVGISQTHLVQRLSRLTETGLVIKNGLFYHLEDRLFRYWIKYVYERRLKAVDVSVDKLSKNFKTEIGRSFENFILVSGQEFSSRVIDLLQCFDNDAISLNGRKYKLPFFRNILPLNAGKNSENATFIRASSSEGDWFIALNDEPLGENELSSFLAESRKMNKKPLRRVIINLGGLEQNARLRALEERMWIWNEDELNELLNIFDKPYIMK